MASAKRRPTKRFTEIGDVFRAPGAPWTGALGTALNDNRDHNREVTMDPAVHVAALAHRHTGKDSAHLEANPDVPNLLLEGLITLESIVSGADSAWICHPKDEVQRTERGIPFTAAPQWATHLIGDVDGPDTSSWIFGAGAVVLVSAYLHAPELLTAGRFEFGLILGGKGKDDDSKTFARGCRVVVPWQVLNVGWTRVFALLEDVGSQFDHSVRFCVQCVETPSVGVTANLIDVRPGRVLDYWVPGYRADVNINWLGYGSDLGPPPPLDKSLAMPIWRGGTAVELAPAKED